MTEDPRVAEDGGEVSCEGENIGDRDMTGRDVGRRYSRRLQRPGVHCIPAKSPTFPRAEWLGARRSQQNAVDAGFWPCCCLVYIITGGDSSLRGLLQHLPGLTLWQGGFWYMFDVQYLTGVERTRSLLRLFCSSRQCRAAGTLAQSALSVP